MAVTVPIAAYTTVLRLTGIGRFGGGASPFSVAILTGRFSVAILTASALNLPPVVAIV
jgi:hypothetical protein